MQRRGLTLFPRGSFPFAFFLFAAVAPCFVLASAQAQAPLAATQSAGPVRATYATLNGSVVAKGNPTVAWFEWGTNREYGFTTAPQDIGSGTHLVRLSAPLTDLVEGGVYHFRVVASNAAGIKPGFDSMFTTGMRVQHWGSFTEGAPTVPPGLTNLSGIACGHRHSIGIHNDGTVAAWVMPGFYSNYGQTNVPTGLSNVVAVAGGFSHCLAVKEDGTVVAWGKYVDGTPATVPPNLTNVIAVGGGDLFSAALKADGKVVAWGQNANYPGTTNVPSNLNDVVAISCGTGHTLALKADGTVVVWGGDIGARSAPASATNVVAVATMGWWNLALRADGTVVDWGITLYPDVPKPPDATNVQAIVSGYGYAEVLKADGTLEGWGRADDATNIPPGLSNVVAFASGDYHRLGLAPVNLAPKCLARTVRGPMNNALTVSLAPGLFDPNGDPTSVRIASLPVHGSLYQSTTNGLGSAISAPDTVVADASHVFFVPEQGAYGAPYDTFSIVANDGQLDSAPATWSLWIVPPPLIQATITTNGPTTGVLLSFTGLTNVAYVVLGSTDLNSWSYLGQAARDGSNQFSYTNYPVDSSPSFYRVRMQ